jgi:enamine deaminase RidA (YjgF/YER057c/UK114 family)
MEHVVRSRLFVTDITGWREVGEVHRIAFAAVPPVSTIVQVSALFDPRLLVEVEVDACLNDPAAGSRAPDLSDISA